MLKIHSCCVDSSEVGNKIFGSMLELLIDLGKQKGFKYLFSFATNSRIAKAMEKMGMSRVSSLKGK